MHCSVRMDPGFHHQLMPPISNLSQLSLSPTVFSILPCLIRTGSTPRLA